MANLWFAKAPDRWNRKPAVRIMEKVCHDNEKLAHKLFHENAEALLGEVAKS